MARDLGSLASYICHTYPDTSDLSNARLTKLIYLADWRASTAGLGQLSGIDWIFNHYGPFVPDVLTAVRQRPDLEIVHDVNYYGAPKTSVRPVPGTGSADLDPDARTVIDTVIAATHKMYFNEFIDYVYETPPVAGSPRGSHLNLRDFAATQTPDPLPSLVTSRQLSAEDFAVISDDLHEEVSKLLLDADWLKNVGDDEPIRTDQFLLDDLDIDSFTQDADMRLETENRRWRGTVTIHADASALVLRDEAADQDNYYGDGYDLHDADWDDFYVLIGRSFDGVVHFSVNRRDQGFHVRIDRIDLE